MSEMREMVCIVCPVGCNLRVRRDGEAVIVEGNECRRGQIYGEQEFTCPMRTVTSSVRVAAGQHPVCAVKTRGQVPKAAIPDVLEAIRKCWITAPVEAGTVVIADVAGTGVDVIATAGVRQA